MEIPRNFFEFMVKGHSFKEKKVESLEEVRRFLENLPPGTKVEVKHREGVSNLDPTARRGKFKHTYAGGAGKDAGYGPVVGFLEKIYGSPESKQQREKAGDRYVTRVEHSTYSDADKKHDRVHYIAIREGLVDRDWLGRPNNVLEDRATYLKVTMPKPKKGVLGKDARDKP